MTDEERVHYLTTFIAEHDERTLREELLWACRRLEELRSANPQTLRPKPVDVLRRVLEQGIRQALELERGGTNDCEVIEVSGAVMADLLTVFEVSDARTSRMQRAATKGRPNAWQPWTPEFDDDLKRRWFAREPVKEIAKAMGRSQSAITARLVKLGVVPEVSGMPPGEFGPARTETSP